MCRHFSLVAALLIPQLLVGQEPKLDAYGDPLPAGALARLGTVRWRHGDGTVFVSFLPDGKALLTIGRDGTVRQWDVATGQELKREALPKANASADKSNRFNVPQLSDLSLLSTDGKIRRFIDPAGGSFLRTIPETSGNLAVSPDSKLLALRDNQHSSIQLYDFASGKKGSQLGEDTAKPSRFVGTSLVFSPDSKMLISLDVQSRGNTTSVLTAWEVATANQMYQIMDTAKLSCLRSPVFSPDGKLLAWIKADGAILLADAQTGKEVGQLKENTKFRARPEEILFSPDGKTVACREHSGTGLRLWDVASGKKKGEYFGLPWRLALVQDVGKMAFSHDGALLAFAGDSSTIGLLDITTGKLLPSNGHVTPVTSISFMPDAHVVISAEEDQSLHVWNSDTGKEGRRIAAPRETRATAVSRDGRALLFADTWGEIRLRDATTSKEIQSLNVNMGYTAIMAISPDGKFLALIAEAYPKAAISIYSLSERKVVRTLKPPDPEPQAEAGDYRPPFRGPSQIVFSLDGRILTVPFDYDKLALWDLSTGKELPQIRMPERRLINSFAVSPDDRSVCLDLVCGEIRLWEIATGKERRQYESSSKGADNVRSWVAPSLLESAPRLSSFSSSISNVMFSTDGRMLAHGRPGGAIELWEIITGKELGQLRGHQADITTLAFASDGNTLASGSRDTTALIWDLKEFKGKVKPKPSYVDSAAYWQNLLSDDAVKAFDAVCALAATPDKAVTYLKEHVRPALMADAATVNRLIADLDSEQFDVRKKVNDELTRLGEVAVPLIRTALAGDVSPEARKRLEALLAKEPWRLPTGETLRSLRAIEVLEIIGTSEAITVLEELAKGTPGATVTLAAKESLQRMKR
jgi:WD40 repeat protein